jgi:hypothetical protein
MKTKRQGGKSRPEAPKMTLHRETLRHLADGELERAAGQRLTHTCGTCTGGTGPTCSGWPPCTC